MLTTKSFKERIVISQMAIGHYWCLQRRSLRPVQCFNWLFPIMVQTIQLFQLHNTRPSEVTIPCLCTRYTKGIKLLQMMQMLLKCEATKMLLKCEATKMLVKCGSIKILLKYVATKMLLKYEATKCCSNVRLQSKWWLCWILSRHQSAKCNLFSTRLMDNSSTSKFRFSETKFIQKQFYIHIH